jgi:hypothetical protein
MKAINELSTFADDVCPLTGESQSLSFAGYGANLARLRNVCVNRAGVFVQIYSEEASAYPESQLLMDS